MSASNLLKELSKKAAAIRASELPLFQALFPRLLRQLTESSPEEGSTSASIIEHSLFRCKEISSANTSAKNIPGSTSSEIGHAHKWLESMLEYNVPHGKLARGLALSINYQILQYGYEVVERAPGSLRQSEDVTGARVLGWCVELFQAYFLVLDDIMDGSITRRGQPCWYRKVNVFRFLF